MAETINIAEIAVKLSKDIFRHFHWKLHPKKDDNFVCFNPNHKVAGGEAQKSTHPCDAIFYYDDPYLGREIFLHTDLKSYKTSTLNSGKLRTALRSLAMSVECAQVSDDWRTKYSVDPNGTHQVRGMLFVHNREADGVDKFSTALAGVRLDGLPIARGSILHFLGPHDIQRLHSITTDMLRLKGAGELPAKYTFFHPDLVTVRRQGDIWDQPATFEMMTGPFLIVRHGEEEPTCPRGYLVYYNRPGRRAEEFEYFLDYMSRLQMLDSDETLRIRMCARDADEEFRSHFQLAKEKYARA